MKALFRLGLGAAAALGVMIWTAYGGAAERLHAEFTKEPTGAASGLEYHYVIKVTSSDGTPVEGAIFEISSDMPAMPGAHHMPHIAGKSADDPGVYHAKIDFVMPGEWRLVLRFEKPHRDVVVLNDMVDKYGDAEE